MEIEPDGQQFLNASADEAADGGAGDSSVMPPTDPPTGGGSTRTTTIVFVVIVIAVLVGGGIAFATLTGDDQGRRELETADNSDVDIRDRVTTTTEAPPETTTTTVAPTTTSEVVTDGTPAPFPDFGPQPGAAPGTPGFVQGSGVSCPGGGIATEVVSTSITTTGPSSVNVEIKGTVANNTTAAVRVDLTISISHNGNNHPNPWTSPVNVAPPTLSPGGTGQWRFAGTITGGQSANVSAIGGGFQWADPALASCPTQ